MNKDPVKECELYKDFGCSHVDGFLCNCGDCPMRKDYQDIIEAFNLLEE